MGECLLYPLAQKQGCGKSQSCSAGWGTSEWPVWFLCCTEKFFLGHWNSSLLLPSPLNGGSYLGQTIPSPWTLIQCTLFCRGGRNGPTSGSSTPLSQNATVCGGLYGLLCLWGPSPSPRCWMSAPWLSSASFAPRKWGEEGEEKERGSRGRGRERAVNGTIT